LRIQGLVALCGCSAALGFVALAPMTALADNPGNPGHHYGQLSNPGHHYGQLKHQPAPSPTPRLTPPPTPQPATHPAPQGATQGVGSQVKIANTVAPTSLGADTTSPVEVVTSVSPASLPERNVWLVAIIVASVLAANIAAAVIMLGRGGYYLVSHVSPDTVTASLSDVLQPRSSNMLNRQAGQGMVEYALILVLVSIVVIVILLTLGNQIANVFSNVVAALG
jgi:pilus assembly protein Flp/PilA